MPFIFLLMEVTAHSLRPFKYHI